MQNNKKRIIYTAVVALIVVFSSTFAVLMTLERNDYRNYLQGEYSKSMYDLIDSIQNIRVNLGKAAIAGSKEQNTLVMSEIFRQSSIASLRLHSLPLSPDVSGGVSKFISQVGDFCYSLSKVSTNGQTLSENDYNSIDKLKDEAFSLENDLKKTAVEINEGSVKWGEIRKKVSGVLPKKGEEVLAQKFSGIQKQILQYPALIYDGPFADNVLDIKPKIQSQKEISPKEAESIARKAVGESRVDSIEYRGNEGQTKIPTYRYYITVKGRSNKNARITCEVSKNGGKVVYFIDSRNPGKGKITPASAVNIGDKYLEGLGYKNMTSTYITNYGNSAVVNYVYNQGNVVIYPDQIKVKIALDDGSIIGVESEKYLISHVEGRSISAPKVSQEEAKKKVSPRLNISTIRLAIIPTETNEEVLCYEFSGSYNKDSYKVYINVLTGAEQRILQIINTPNGQLTM